MNALGMRTRIAPWLRTHRFQLLLLFVGVLIPLLLFGALAEDVMEQEVFAFDAPLLLWLHSHATPFWDRVMQAASLVGFAYGVVPVDMGVLLFLSFRRRWGDTLFWILAVGGAGLLNVGAKAFFGRVRPDLWLSLAPELTYSFPSGHAMGSMAFVAALAVLTWPTRWFRVTLLLGSVFVVLVGLSRVYLGVHYPSDILAGWAASLAWVIGVSSVIYGRAAKPTPQATPTIN